MPVDPATAPLGYFSFRSLIARRPALSPHRQADALSGDVHLDDPHLHYDAGHNCLAKCEHYLERFVSGALDIWALREGDRLVAVLAVERETACVSEALGPGNAYLDVEDASRVARLCARTGWTIGARCVGLLLDFAPEKDEFFSFVETRETLTPAFDPQGPAWTKYSPAPIHAT